MANHNLKKGQSIYFINENLPYEIKAISERYAVVVRAINIIEDEDLLQYDVNRGAFKTIEAAFAANKDNPVYSILDFEEKLKGPDNHIFSYIDYSNDKDCEHCLELLIEGEIGLSKRRCVKLNIDWIKTLNQK